MRPNIKRKKGVNFLASSSRAQAIISILLSLPIVLITCLDLPNELFSNTKLPPQESRINQTFTTINPAQNNKQQPKFSRDVSNLKLTSDFRAIKLSWIYEHSDANVPVLFDVRYCEITPWDIEIKCRHKELFVDQNKPDAAATSGTESRQKQQQQLNDNMNENSTVILKQQSRPIDLVTQLEPPMGSHYEAHIYDLRALTNYTFHVRVMRFAHEQSPLLLNKTTASSFDKDNQSTILLSNHHKQPQTSGTTLSAAQQNWYQSSRIGRGNQLLARLSDTNLDNNINELPEPIARIETKPFAAEATKCLADVSEVVINTGKYFGGKISAEHSSDPRCSLIGNKTSEQSSYLFKIDHELCNSKIMDGNRIETMVLVHENKDILTHNTARFLVLCNFKQKSFTLRASVSLPKVNGLFAPKVKQAVITSLPTKPTTSSNNSTEQANNETTSHEQTKAVMLGSMPGIYRTRAAAAAASATTEAPKSLSQKELANEQASNSKTEVLNRTSNSNVGGRYDELELNTIEKIINGKLLLQQQEAAARRALALTMPADILRQQQQRQSKELNNFPREGQEQALSLAQQQQDLNKQFFTGLRHKEISNALKNSNGDSGGGGGGDGINNHNSNYGKARALTWLSPDELQLQLLNKNDNGKSNYKILLPEPVQVQSRVLYVDRSSLSSRSTKQPQKEFSLVSGIQQQQQETKTTTQPPTTIAGTIKTNMARENSSLNVESNEISASQKSMLLSSVSGLASTSPASGKATGMEQQQHADLRKSLKQLIAPGKTSLANEETSVDSAIVGDSLEHTGADSQSRPIIMTNNHRISGDYLPLTNNSTVSSSTNNNNNNNTVNFDNNYSIKYSAAKIDEYPLLVDSSDKLNSRQSLQSRSRTGRIKSIESSLTSREQLLNADYSSSQMRSFRDQLPTILASGDSSSINRMGEMIADAMMIGGQNNTNDLWANSSNNNEQVVKIFDPVPWSIGRGENSSSSSLETTLDAQPSPPTTLAQNITSYLLRWSLKTLKNIAKKSLESLIKTDNNTESSQQLIPQQTFEDDSPVLTNASQMFDRQEYPQVVDDEFLRTENSGQAPSSSLENQKKLNSMLSAPTVATPNNNNNNDKLQNQAIKVNLGGVNSIQHGTTINGTINPITTTTMSATKQLTLPSTIKTTTPRPNTTTTIQTAAIKSTSLSLKEKDELLDSAMLIGQPLPTGTTTPETSSSQTGPTNVSMASSTGQRKIPLQSLSKTSGGVGSGSSSSEEGSNLNVGHQHQLSNFKHHQRPTNYSKSLDWNKQDSSSSSLSADKTNNKIHSSASPSYRHQKAPLAPLEQQQKINQDLFNSDNNNNNNETGHVLYSSWRSYAFIMLVSIVTGILLVFWLVSLYLISMSRRHNLANQHHPTGNKSECTLRPTVQFHDQLPQTSSIFDNNNNNQNAEVNNNNNNNNASIGNAALNKLGNRVAMHCESSSSPSYKKYADYAINNDVDISLARSNNNFNDNILVAEKNALPKQSTSSTNQKLMLMSSYVNGAFIAGNECRASPSTGSQSTRSTSVGSSRIIADETDCKNNEFFYTEHVLINTGTAFGESYA